MNSILAAGIILAQVFFTPEGNIITPGGQQLDPTTGIAVCRSQEIVTTEYIQRFQAELATVVIATPEQFSAWFEILSALIPVTTPEGTVAASFLLSTNPTKSVLMLEFDANDCFIGYREIGRGLWDDVARVLRGEAPQNNGTLAPNGIVPI